MMENMAELEVDGSLLEGGGQIVRMSVALSAILGRPFRIKNVRKGRASPGLRAQHLAGVRLVGQICGADTSGVQLGSTEFGFRPGTAAAAAVVRGTREPFSARIETAGAVTLLFQASLPCLMFSADRTPAEVLVTGGGTNVGMAPTVEYYNRVFRANLRHFLGGSGSEFLLDVGRKGYFPKGGARVRLEVVPVGGGPAAAVANLRAADLTDPGTLKRVVIQSSVAGVLPLSVAQRMAEGARRGLAQGLEVQVEVEVESFKEQSDKAAGNGSSVILVAETSTGCVLGSSGLGSPKADPFAVGQEAARELAESLRRRVCVDQHCQDQLIVFMALASGVSRVLCGPLTLHTETAIHVAQLMTGAEFGVEAAPDGNCIVSCKGIGFEHRPQQQHS